MSPYEFAVVRYMHDAFAGELVNIGVVLLDRDQSHLYYRFSSKYTRLKQLYPSFDGQGFRKIVGYLDARTIALRQEYGLAGETLYSKTPVKLKDLLVELLPQDTAVLQASEIFGGIADSPQERFGQLYLELIDRNDMSSNRERHDDQEIWSRVESALQAQNLLNRVSRDIPLVGRHYRQTFHISWNNGVQQVLEPVSMDYLQSGEIVETAMKWVGRLAALAKTNNFKFTAVVSPPPLKELLPAFQRAIAILEDTDEVRAVVPEDQIEGFLPEIERDLQHQGSPSP